MGVYKMTSARKAALMKAVKASAQKRKSKAKNAIARTTGRNQGPMGSSTAFTRATGGVAATRAKVKTKTAGRKVADTTRVASSRAATKVKRIKQRANTMIKSLKSKAKFKSKSLKRKASNRMGKVKSTIQSRLKAGKTAYNLRKYKRRLKG